MVRADVVMVEVGQKLPKLCRKRAARCKRGWSPEDQSGIDAEIPEPAGVAWTEPKHTPASRMLTDSPRSSKRRAPAAVRAAAGPLVAAQAAALAAACASASDVYTTYGNGHYIINGLPFAFPDGLL